MKRLMLELIKFDMSDLSQPMKKDRVAHMGISIAKQLCYKHQNSHAPNMMHKLPKFIFFVSILDH